MELRPILATLRKHRIPAVLIVLEIALACAVLCNAVFMISLRVRQMHLPNAIDERGISLVSVNGADPKLAASDIPRDLTALRGIAGVTAASVSNTVPLSTNNIGWSFGTSPDATLATQHTVNLSMYFVGEGADQALGLKLKQGRFFTNDEYADSKLGSGVLPGIHVAVLTESAAKRMWPGQSPLGKTFYSKPDYYQVVGVVADVMRPWVSDAEHAYNAVYFPLAPDAMTSGYIVRSAPEDRQRVLQQATQTLQKLNPGAVVKGRTFTDIRNRYFADTNSMAWMLVLVCVVMLAVTAFGIVGLTSFWVAQRRRQIGVRRAVGATRTDILRYFQAENFLLASFGIALGMALAYGLNLFLMKHYELPRLPGVYLPVGAAVLWAIGQLAVLGPALRASNVPPVVATRAA